MMSSVASISISYAKKNKKKNNTQKKNGTGKEKNRDTEGQGKMDKTSGLLSPAVLATHTAELFLIKASVGRPFRSNPPVAGLITHHACLKCELRRRSQNS